MKQPVIYPRGFAGYDVGWPILREEASLNGRDAIARFSKLNSRETNTISATNIERLYMDAKTLKYANNSPELIADTFAAFCNAFGTHNFFEWLTMQRQNVYFTREHAKFLIDCLEFAFTGKRYTGFSAWYVLLTHGTPKAEKIDNFNFERFFYDGNREYANVQNLAKLWMAQPNGVTDMVSSLHVIFGTTR